MPELKVILDGDGCWPDFAEKLKLGLLIETQVGALAYLPAGMVGGNPSVAFRVDLPDGRVVFAETSLKLLGVAVDAMRAKFAASGTMPTPGVGKNQ